VLRPGERRDGLAPQQRQFAVRAADVQAGEQAVARRLLYQGGERLRAQQRVAGQDCEGEARGVAEFRCRCG
jgi:hypothetical protein